MITKKQKEVLLAEAQENIIDIINIVSVSDEGTAHKMKLVSYLLLIKNVIDLETERLDYEKLIKGAKRGKG